MFIKNEDTLDPEKGKDKVNNLLMMQACVCTGMCILMILFMQERPKYFPSQAAKNQQSDNYSFWRDLKNLLSDPNYIKCLIVFTLM